MLLDPATVVDHLDLYFAVVVAVLFGNAAIAFFTAAAFPYSGRTALVVGAGLAQLGEFSFIIADQGLRHDLISVVTYNVVLAAAGFRAIVARELRGEVSAAGRDAVSGGPGDS